MTVRRQIAALAALAVLLIGSGCSDRDNAPLPAETDEPLYVQGMQLKRQGRNPEALTAFLKVIDKRGMKGAPESHVESGSIYLNHIKDPVEAYHHFRKYLELEPKSKQAEFVRGALNTAKREFASSLPARPLDDQSVRLQAADELAKLRRDNEELRAELATLRGGGATPLPRAPRMITLPDEVRATPSPAPVANESLITLAPPRRESEVTVAPAPAPQKNPPPARAGSRTHTVKPKETLFAISRQYGVSVADLMAANGIRNPSAVAVGAVLKIPSAR